MKNRDFLPKLLKLSYLLLIVFSVAYGRPKVKFPVINYDFGEVIQNSRLTYDFVFYNKGKDSLIIENIRSSCGCTTTWPSKKRLGPKEEAKIGVVFTTRGYSGNFKKTITVKTNDPKKPVVTLSITGKILVEVRIAPRTVYIRIEDKKNIPEFVTKELKIKNYSKRTIKVLEAKTNTPSIILDSALIKLPAEINSEREKSFQIKVLTNGLKKGWKKIGEIELKTDSKLNPKFNICVYISI